jgi:hypothetical protein
MTTNTTIRYNSINNQDKTEVKIKLMYSLIFILYIRRSFQMLRSLENFEDVFRG